jgi:hypothetical protein
LINRRETAEAAFDEASNTKTNLEAQITTLEDLVYATDNEDIIAEI